jgi:hypothetical protein
MACRLAELESNSASGTWQRIFCRRPVGERRQQLPAIEARKFDASPITEIHSKSDRFGDAIRDGEQKRFQFVLQ